jgi:uncharacterized protein
VYYGAAQLETVDLSIHEVNTPLRKLQRKEHFMAGKFDLKKAANGEFMFNLLAANGQIILTSETYKAKASAQNGIQSVKTNSVDDTRYTRSTTDSGKFYFSLKARNGEIIGKSQMYASESGRDNGIDSCKTNAGAAVTDDNA